MKNLFRILIIGVLSLCASCEKEPFLDYELPNLGECLEFTADGGTAEIQITADCSYEVQCKDDWVYAFVTEGGISVSVQANTEIIERETKINILYYHRKEQICKSIKVKQGAFEPILSIDEDEIEVSAEGGSKYVEVTTNAEFDITAEVDWITCEEQKNGINIIIASSNIIDDRSANITVSLPKYDIIKVITVHQEAAQPSLKIDVEEIVFNADGGTKRIAINANTSFVISENADWISCTKESDGLKITTRPSTITKERSAKIIISLSKYDVSKEIMIIQKAFEPQLVIDGSHTFTFDFRGGKKKVGVISNFNYNVECNSEWLTIISKSNTGIEISLELNNSTEARSTTFRVFDTQYGIEDMVITITQTAAPSTNIIEYTNDFAGIIKPYDLTAFEGINIISNTYVDGKGVMIFDAPIYSIGAKAFYNSLLTSVKIPDAVTIIGNRAFYGCAKLKEIHIGKGIRTIEDYAFYDCQLLKSITIQNDNLSYIGTRAFYASNNPTRKVNISNLSSWIQTTFKDYFSNPFYRSAELYINSELVENLIIPSNITTIKQYAFNYCGSIVSVSISDSVTRIEKEAFACCANLERIDFGTKVSYIGNRAFAGGVYTNLILPDNVSSICDGAFSNDNLCNVTLGCGVSSIGNDAFKSSKLLNIYCRPTTPPSIFYDKKPLAGTNRYLIYTAFPLNEGMKIYVPRNSYNEYMQWGGSKTYWGETDKENWYYYEQYIEPYDFE